jgi:hypothetical protein
MKNHMDYKHNNQTENAKEMGSFCLVFSYSFKANYSFICPVLIILLVGFRNNTVPKDIAKIV